MAQTRQALNRAVDGPVLLARLKENGWQRPEYDRVVDPLWLLRAGVGEER